MKSLSGLMLIAMVLLIVIPSLAIAQSPGDTVGMTAYYNQSNGSTGRRIAVDASGNAHFTWSYSDLYPGARFIYYNYYGSSGFVWPGMGQSISRNGCGYPQIDVTSDNLAAIFYHMASPIGSESLYCAIDAAPGLGVFATFRPPNRLPGNNHLVWPYLTVDRNNRIHAVATTIYPSGGPQPFGYTRSNNGGSTWTAIQVVDTLRTISPIIVSSPVSDKVAMVYCHPTDSVQTRNDIFYVQSEDGINWDFETQRINMTGYGRGGDSLFAYTDVDAAYDYNDVLHMVWNARYVTAAGNSARTFLFHADPYSDYIAEITRHDMPQTERSQFLASNLGLNKISIASDSAHSTLYVVYCRFDTTDTSISGFANGELFMQYSQDGGFIWSNPTDITNSRTPGCIAGDCASDLFPSIAKRVDNYIHVFYECVNWSDFIEPMAPANMLYLRLPADEQGIADNIPESEGLYGNYPNPFNAQTTIKYSLKEKSQITISIYNIVGEKVTILLSGTQQSGEHHTVWDASRFSSGIYFAKLESMGVSQSIRMVLLK